MLAIMNFIITGRPGTGKTTLLKEIILSLSGRPAFGFYTEEVRTGETRTGFLLKTLNGAERLLAHINFKGRHRVCKYGVDLEAMRPGIREIEQGLNEGGLIVIDEIGKMELFSAEFREVVLKALDSKCDLLATMGIIKDPFIRKIKERGDVEILTLSRENYIKVKASILGNILAI